MGECEQNVRLGCAVTENVKGMTADRAQLV